MILKYNLQFFAAEGPGGEKTEPATEKKLSDARKEGQVAKSREVGNALGILAMFVVLKVFIGTIGTQLMELFSSVYGNMPETVKSWNGYLPEKGMRDVCFSDFYKDHLCDRSHICNFFSDSVYRTPGTGQMEGFRQASEAKV